MEHIQDEVLRKIGRNMLLFQKMEYTLKWLISVQQISGSPSDIASNWQSRNDQVSRQTLGQLVGKVTDQVKIEAELDESDNDVDDDITEIHISIKTQFEVVDHENWSNRLSTMVDERNELIHHLLPSLYPKSPEKWLAVGKKLDEQKNRILNEIDHFDQIIKTIKSQMEMNFNFINSNALTSVTEFMNDDNILDYTLAKATEKYSRPDGWTLLSHAGTLIAEKCPIALSNTYKKYGCHSLKNLITKLENFECQMEATANGERVIYKVK